MEIAIKPAYDDIGNVRELFCEYTQALGIDLGFQNYEEELTALPGEYAPPGGRLYTAYRGGKPAGCIALRPFDTERCEMKRLYVKPEHRGIGLGKALAQRVIDDAIEIGYKKMVLDTLSSMKSAARLYTSPGFYEIAPYYDNPYADTVYLCLELQQ